MSDYNIRDVDYRYIREKIAYIPQNIELFTGTIFENLRVGTPNATYEQVISACKKSGADEFINKLPNTYWSYIEEGGSNLSGGERQRIAIARSLLKQANIYIFDEATSNLDSFSELKIQNLIFNTIKDKTVIIIAHRLSTINLCDLIYFVENGEILERGNHEELMNLGGKYASMISIQSSNALKSNKIEKVGFENSNGDEITYG